MRKIGSVRIFILVLVITLGISAGQAVAEKKVILKLQSAFPLAMPSIGTCATHFKEKVEAASDGTMIVKLFEPGKLVPPFQIYKAVSDGKIDAGYTSPGYLSGKVPGSELTCNYPFINLEIFIAWYYEGNGKKLTQEMLDTYRYNCKTFPMLMLGPETGGWFAKPINSPDDLKGLKIRMPFAGGKVYQKLGGTVKFFV